MTIKRPLLIRLINNMSIHWCQKVILLSLLKTLVFSLLVSFHLTDIDAQNLIYVDIDARGLSNGEDWDNAYTDLHDAIRKATSGSSIWIAKGTYKTSISGNRFSAFDLDKSINIYGGFAGVEHSLEERRPNNITTISGEIGLLNEITDNSYHIFRIDEPNTSILIDGVIIEGAYGDFEGEKDFFLDGVGAVLIDNIAQSNMSIKFKNVIFRDNFALTTGGAIYIQDKSNSSTLLQIEGCLFTSDFAKEDGSAIYGSFNSESAKVIISSTTVDNISSDESSFSVLQLLFRGSENSLTIEGCLFKNNKSINPDPILAFGLFGPTKFDLKDTRFLNNEYGQIMFVSASGGDEPNSVAINNVDIIDNITFSSPLQILNTAFGEKRSNVSIDDLNITNNVNGDTWILIDLHEINLNSFDNNTFIGNKGGPMFLNPIYDDLEINNLIVADNSFLDVDFTNQFVFKNFENYDITFNNSTFAYNEGIKGTLLRTFFNKNNGIIGNINFNNCIFFANQDFGEDQPPEQLVYAENMSVNYNHCLMDATSCELTASLKGLGRINCDESNLIDSDPSFVSDQDYSLAFCSPAIDAGSNELSDHIEKDNTGATRVINKKVDMGALESEPVTRDFGFSCLQGLIYSDWLSDLSQDIVVRYIDTNGASALEEESIFEIIAEGGCIDTVIVDVLEMNTIETPDYKDALEVDIGDTLNIPYINYSTDPVLWTAFLDEEKIDVVVSDDQLLIKTLGAGSYTIVAVNQFGCFYKKTITVEIVDVSSILYIPNSFSPNNDGINDDLIAAPLNNQSVIIENFRLYNRWGTILADIKDMAIENESILIEGRILREQNLPSDVYIYSVKVRDGTNVYSFQGNITLFN